MASSTRQQRAALRDILFILHELPALDDVRGVVGVLATMRDVGLLGWMARPCELPATARDNVAESEVPDGR